LADAIQKRAMKLNGWVDKICILRHAATAVCAAMEPKEGEAAACGNLRLHLFGLADTKMMLKLDESSLRLLKLMSGGLCPDIAKTTFYAA
jgi:hypothetical protein